MTSIKVSRIISVSSEDPKYPASNLLKGEGTGCWKCKDPGIRNAVLILELSEESLIYSIDIGNESSALIEVLVAKSADPDNYQVLIIATPLTTIQEARNGYNKNAVRFFKHENFSKPTADQSWDRVKIICSQPFNSSIQFGLSLIKFHSKCNANKLAVSNDISLGKYSLKVTDESDINVGSLFLKRKDPPLSLPGSEIAKKKKTDITGDTTSEPPETTINGSPLRDKNNKSSGSLQSKKNKVPTSKTDKLTSNDVSKVGKAVAKAEVSTSKSKAAKRTPTAGSYSTTSKAESNKPATEPNTLPNNQRRKPFNQLFENVVFVISGYQNPYRAELRSNAVEMGAKYKANWDRTCTHLVCAFMNTPKYQEARGNGHIVIKNWIEDSYNQRRRLSWKKYALNKNDVNDDDSDEEVWEEQQEGRADNERQKLREEAKKYDEYNEEESSGDEYKPEETSEDGDDSDTEDEIERVKKRQTARYLKSSKKSVYEVDTDVEEDVEDKTTSSGLKNDGNNRNNNTRTYDDRHNVPGTSKNSIPYIPEFFEGTTFFVDFHLSLQIKKQVWRYIVSHDGRTTDDASTAHYIVSHNSNFNTNGRHKVVCPQWILDCHDAGKVLPLP